MELGKCTDDVKTKPQETCSVVLFSPLSFIHRVDNVSSSITSLSEPCGKNQEVQSVSLRRLISTAVTNSKAESGCLHILILHTSDDRKLTVSKEMRTLISHAYMTAWDICEEHNKHFIDIIVHVKDFCAVKDVVSRGIDFSANSVRAKNAMILQKIMKIDQNLRSGKSSEVVQSHAHHIYVGSLLYHSSNKECLLLNKLLTLSQDCGALIVPVSPAVTEEMLKCQKIISLSSTEQIPLFANVAMGGTFDHMHSGHRLLLTMANLVCKDSARLVVGVTNDAMLSKKKYRSLIEPVAKRCQNVYDFFARVNPSLNLEVSVLENPGGPAIVDPSLEAIIVSSETLNGALWINKEREKKNLKRLTILTVERSAAASCSSTFLRKLLHERLHQQTNFNAAPSSAESNRFDTKKAATTLLRAWASEGRSLLQSLNEVPTPPSIDEVYAMHEVMRQHPLINSPSLGGFGGYKMGGIGAVTDVFTGLPVPAVYGILVKSGIYDIANKIDDNAFGKNLPDGRNDVTASISSPNDSPKTVGSCTAQNLFGIEAEIGFIMGNLPDLHTNAALNNGSVDGGSQVPISNTTSLSAEEVYAAVSEVRICIELCGRRFALNLSENASNLQSLGDASCAGGVVMGKGWRQNIDGKQFEDGGKQENFPTPALLQKIESVIYVNGVEKARGCARMNPLGSPLASLVWCTNHLRQRNIQIQPGELVIAGACCKTREFNAGDTVEAVFHGLGSVRCVIGN